MRLKPGEGAEAEGEPDLPESTWDSLQRTGGFEMKEGAASQGIWEGGPGSWRRQGNRFFP